MRTAALVCAFVSTAILSLTGAGATRPNDKATSDLKKVLNSKGYILASPAQNWAYPGGFLVATKAQATFIELPSEVDRPKGEPAKASFMSEREKSRFSIGAILTGLTAVIGGNPGFGFGRTKDLKFAQLDAEGSRVPYPMANKLLANAAITDTVKKWLKAPGRQVFIVQTVLTTNRLSVAGKSSTNLDLSFNGKAVSSCSEGGAISNAGDKGEDTSNKSSTNTTPSAPATPTAKPTDAAKDSTSTPKSDSSKTDSALPGGELHVCIGREKEVKMKTATPLIFAASAYRVTLLRDGSLQLEPELAMPERGQFETKGGSETVTYVRTISGVSPQWSRKTWAEMQAKMK